MLTFTQYITELFNNPHPYTKSVDHGDHVAHFTTEKGHDYHVHFTHYDEHKKGKGLAEIQFRAPNSPEHNKTKINHQEGHSASRVFSTVHHIIKNHLAEHPNIHKINFSASGDEPSRIKLYHHLTKRFSTKHTIKSSNAGSVYTIHRNDIKD